MGQINKGILLFIHEHMPSALTPFFAVVTLAVSAVVVAAVAAFSALVFGLMKRRFEAMLVLAALCLGAFIPLMINIGRELRAENAQPGAAL